MGELQKVGAIKTTNQQGIKKKVCTGREKRQPSGGRQPHTPPAVRQMSDFLAGLFFAQGWRARLFDGVGNRPLSAFQANPADQQDAGYRLTDTKFRPVVYPGPAQPTSEAHARVRTVGRRRRCPEWSVGPGNARPHHIPRPVSQPRPPAPALSDAGVMGATRCTFLVRDNQATATCMQPAEPVGGWVLGLPRTTAATPLLFDSLLLATKSIRCFL